MKGKYSSYVRYVAAKAFRSVLHQRIQELVTWDALPSPREGYSIVIGCNTPLAEMLGANLNMLERQNLDHLDRIYVVMDSPREQMPFDVEAELGKRFPTLPLHFLYYTPLQARTLRKLGHPWIYAWLSWCLGMSAARTRYCFLHDFDAMLITPDIIESRYQQIVARSAQYCGVKYYLGNGITPDDALAVTFELMVDLKFVRENFRPIELANTVDKFRGRAVDFDILLYAQSKAGTAFAIPLRDEGMVHPQQVICQFTSLMQKNTLPPGNINLLIVPYFLHLAGNPSLLRDSTDALEQIASGRRAFDQGLPFYNRRLDLSIYTLNHIDWIAGQCYTLERAVNGVINPEVREYFVRLRGVIERSLQPAPSIPESVR